MILPYDWQQYTPNLEATLLWVLQGERVLLMRKKRGLGKGKVNAPGGKLQPGESLLECAVRETEEELCIRVSDARLAGELRFAFTDGLRMRCHVFVGSTFTGVPAETDEAAPFWVHRADIPYAEMWADDTHWLPWMLEGRPFLGRFVFDGDRLVEGDVVARP